MEQEKEFYEKLKEVNARIDALSSPVVEQAKVSSSHSGYLFLFVIIAIMFSALLYIGVETTGFVTFSESVSSSEQESFSVFSSKEVLISTDLDDINSMMLSGTVYGEGKAAVFLKGKDRNYLAYYFEGDATRGIDFTNMCYDTCHVEGLVQDNTLIFDLEGMRIDIDKITYLYSRIIDFDLEPRTLEIDYSKEPAKVIDIRLTNRELADYSVLLYIDGPLSSSFSWQGSLIHMTPEDPEKVIPITVKLPSNLPKGEFTHKITARYVPPGTYDFVGESPVAESFVTVVNK